MFRVTAVMKGLQKLCEYDPNPSLATVDMYIRVYSESCEKDRVSPEDVYFMESLGWHYDDYSYWWHINVE